MKKLQLLVLGIFLFCSITTKEVYSQDRYSDYQIIASFVYRMVSYIEWPEDKYLKGEKKICSLQTSKTDAVVATLSNIIRSSSASNNLTLEQGVSLDEDKVKKCLLIYTSGVASNNTVLELNKFSQKHNIVTMNDSVGFTKKGGMVAFIIEEGEDPIIEVNLTTMKNAGVTINAILLENSVLYD